MKEIRTIYKYYSQIYEKKLEAKKPLIIEAFVKFYGEEHRDYITNEIDNFRLYFYLNNKNVPKRIKKLINNYFKLMCHRLKVLKKRGLSFNKLTEEKIKMIYLDPIDKDSRVYKTLRNNINDDFDNSLGFMFTSEDIPSNNYKAILFPLFGIDDLTLFHELNHVICTHVIGELDSEICYIDPFEEYNFLELMNEFTAIEILKIFRAMNGFVSATPIRIAECYQERFYLIEEFYAKFKSIIKETLITGNELLAEKKLGRTTLKTFIELVSKLCDTRFVTASDKKRLKFLNFMMEEHLKREEDYDYEAYYQELESLGYLVRKL